MSDIEDILKDLRKQGNKICGHFKKAAEEKKKEKDEKPTVIYANKEDLRD